MADCAPEYAAPWVPITEGLPRPGRIVLVWAADVECIFTASLMAHGGGFEWSQTGSMPGDRMRQHVTHWAHLPASPNKETR